MNQPPKPNDGWNTFYKVGIVNGVPELIAFRGKLNGTKVQLEDRYMMFGCRILVPCGELCETPEQAFQTYRASLVGQLTELERKTNYVREMFASLPAEASKMEIKTPTTYT